MGNFSFLKSMAAGTCEASSHNLQTFKCVADKIAGINLKLLPGPAAHKADTLLSRRAKRVSTTKQKKLLLTRRATLLLTIVFGPQRLILIYVNYHYYLLCLRLCHTFRFQLFVFWKFNLVVIRRRLSRSIRIVEPCIHGAIYTRKYSSNVAGGMPKERRRHYGNVVVVLWFIKQNEWHKREKIFLSYFSVN